MNCPRCGRPIGGYVEANSLAARRVSEGKCPHCGSSMPIGYKVGFKESNVPRRKPVDKYSSDSVESENRHNPYRIFSLCVAGVTVIVFGAVNGLLIWGLVIGILLILTALVYYGLMSFNLIDYRNPHLSLTKPRSGIPAKVGWAIGLLACILLSAGFFRNGLGRLGGQWVWIVISFLISGFVLFRGESIVSQTNAERRKGGINDYVVNSLKASARLGQLNCGLCGCTLDENDHFGVSVKGSSAAVLCASCLMKANAKAVGNSLVEIGDREFFII